MARRLRVGESQREFVKAFDALTYRFQRWEVWADFIAMSACAVSNAVDPTHAASREKMYSQSIRKYNKTEMEVFPKLLALLVEALEMDGDQDFLGSLYMQLELGNHWTSQFFTPYCVAKAMAQISTKDIQAEIRQKGFIRVGDCCCGAGGLLVAFANAVEEQLKDTDINWQQHILFVGQDIDYVVALMCYLQLSFLGCAGYVKIGNSLTDPMCSGDKLDNYWFTPVYFSDVWTMRRFFSSIVQTDHPRRGRRSTACHTGVANRIQGR